MHRSLDLEDRRVVWDEDYESLRELFATTWKRHPILNWNYYRWQFFRADGRQAIGYCSMPDEGNSSSMAGFYTVLPTTVLVDKHRLSFSTSLYTITHPNYYRTGIFRRLAALTYADCLRMGVIGTIGVPNKRSLPGFNRTLGFVTIGQFQILAGLASPSAPSNSKVRAAEISDEIDLSGLSFGFDHSNAELGIVLNERSKEFLAWRFFRCPGVKYYVFATVGNHGRVTGLIALRFTTKRFIPLSVVVDCIVDQTSPDAESILKALLYCAYREAWRHHSPLLLVLVNPFSFEAKVFARNGFKEVPGFLLPHDSNFVVKLHGDLSGKIRSKLHDFKSWYFSFADYDIF